MFSAIFPNEPPPRPGRGSVTPCRNNGVKTCTKHRRNSTENAPPRERFLFVTNGALMAQMESGWMAAQYLFSRAFSRVGRVEKSNLLRWDYLARPKKRGGETNHGPSCFSPPLSLGLPRSTTLFLPHSCPCTWAARSGEGSSTRIYRRKRGRAPCIARPLTFGAALMGRSSVYCWPCGFCSPC